MDISSEIYVIPTIKYMCVSVLNILYYILYFTITFKIKIIVINYILNFSKIRVVVGIISCLYLISYMMFNNTLILPYVFCRPK